MNERDDITERILGAAIEVQRILGPGLLESILSVPSVSSVANYFWSAPAR